MAATTRTGRQQRQPNSHGEIGELDQIGRVRRGRWRYRFGFCRPVNNVSHRLVRPLP
jgi:hypothetical protein